MKPTQEQALEWAADVEALSCYEGEPSLLYLLVLRAYGEGQKEMRERASKACDTEWNGDSDTYMEAEVWNECAEVIRALEIDE